MVTLSSPLFPLCPGALMGLLQLQAGTGQSDELGPLGRPLTEGSQGLMVWPSRGPLSAVGSREALPRGARLPSSGAACGWFLSRTRYFI